MSEFGKALFGGSRFVFWSLSPMILLFLVTLPFLIPKWNVGIVIIMVALSIIGIFLILGMFNPSRFGWAFRVVSATVFLAYVAYALSELAENDWMLKKPKSRGEANPVNALIGLVIIGGPALMYTILGRFRFQKEEDEPFDDDELDEDGQPPSEN
ncbi:MAG TPA: hypothetical protein DCZ94_17800 [Lentisphaeria bacterium]|nr:MAG: hypothetical protein A2X48_03650 [Lentisphaerae bacterium GWF2_49_21]HBC88800.1 hypothetical protein [Lentisphaeria bacterium]